MLSERERAIKKLLLSELPGNTYSGKGMTALTYAEKKNLRDDLNLAFIAEQIAEMQSQKKWIWIQAGIVIFMLIGFGFTSGWTSNFLIGFASLIPVTFAVQWHFRDELKKRIFIYRTLRTLAEPSATETASSGSPEPSIPDMQRRKPAGSTIG